MSGEDTTQTADNAEPEAAPVKPKKEDAGEKGAEEPAAGGEEKAAESAEPTKGVIEEREITIDYLTHDMAEVGKGLKEGELIIRELQQEYKDKDQVEITEVQESIM